ncbi:hypothetical protein ACXGQP_15735 [Enterobacter oligotrophicus]
MSTITRERLEEIAEDGFLKHGESKELARIALASLEAEPVSFDDLRDAVAEVSGGPAMEWSDIYKGHQAVPFINFNSLARIVDKFRTAPPAPVSMKDHQIRELVNELRDIAVEYHGTQQLRERIARTIRAAMIQGADQPQSTQQNIPENIPTLRDGLAAIRSLGEIDAGKIQAERDSLNSPVIPDGLNIRAVAALREAVRNQWLKSDEFADKGYWKSMHDIANEIVSAMLAEVPQQEVK